MPAFFKVIFFQLCTWIFLYLSAWVITSYQQYRSVPANNTPLFNFVIFAETILLTRAAHVYYENKLYKLATIFIFIVFVIVFVIQLMMSGLNTFLNYAGVVEGIAMILMYTPVLYFQFSDSKFSWQTSPGVWLCTGLLIYFTGIIPYLSVFNYINHRDPNSSEKLFQSIIDVLANIRYLMLSLSFLLIRKNALTRNLRT